MPAPDPIKTSKSSAKEMQKRKQSYHAIAEASSILKEAVHKVWEYAEFPAVIQGNLVCSETRGNRPLTNARVLLQFQKSGAADRYSADVLTDVNGYFSLLTPEGALAYDKMTVDVARDGITEKFSYSRSEAGMLGGRLGDLIMSDAFMTKGMVEKLGAIVESIGSVVSGYAPAPDGQAAANPQVTLGEGENAFSLTWANAASYGYSYKILHRLVEPEVSPPAVISGDPAKNKQRKDIGCPIDVVGFKKKLVEAPHSQPRMSPLGMGYVLVMNQEWKPSHFSLGTLLYSLALAPGEEQRIAVSERAESLAVTDREASAYYQSDRYSSAQSDNISAIFDSALRESASGAANMKGYGAGFSSGSGSSAAGGGSWGAFSMLGGASALFGFGVSSSSSSSSFSQNRSQDYSTAAAQNFQQNIQRAAETQSQANRVGVRLATASESETVTTKIIANHNHSHALTMQFWEVVHNYKITSSVADVQLVLYIPLDIVPFLPTGVPHVLTPGELYGMTQSVGGKADFLKRYHMLVAHHDSIAPYMPYEFREGLNLLKKFASYPRWEFQAAGSEGGFIVELRLAGSFMPYDSLTAAIRLKNGGRINAAAIEMETHAIPEGFHYSAEVLEAIRRMRLDPSKNAVGTFYIPPGVTDDDFAALELYYGSTPYHYTLTPLIPDFISALFPDKSPQEILSLLSGSMFPFLRQQEAYKNPALRLSQSQLRPLGPLRLSGVGLQRDAETQYVGFQRDEELTSRASYAVFDRVRTMTFEQLQKIERAFQHVVENTMFYSQTVWASLTGAERAMMLEPYTIGIPSETGDIGEEVPLMNCVQNEVYGFYGNCMLMPFCYPPALAEKLGTSTREVQDALFNYHTLAFRAPAAMVSLSTRGMVGEAVLGSSNASEKIDLTRFWNWQDSPITHADTIKPSDFSQAHIITDETAAPDSLAKTGNTVTINTGGAAAPDLISAIAKTPAPMAIVGLGELQQFASTMVTTSASERQNVISNASQMTQQAIAGYVNMKAGVGMNGEKAEKKEEAKKEEKPKEEKPATPEKPKEDKPTTPDKPATPEKPTTPDKPA